MHTWEVIYSLIRFHPIEPITLDGSIRPKYIPILVIIDGCPEFEHFSDGPEHWVVAMIKINNYTLFLVFDFFLL